MEQFGRRTREFYNFSSDLDQAFLLAQALSRAGLTALGEVGNHVNCLVQNVAGVTAEQLAAMTNEEKMQISARASADENEQIEQLLRQAEEYQRLGNETAPTILFIYVITKFEAYLEDITSSISYTRPELLSLPSGANEDAIQEEVAQLLANRRIDVIARDIFEARLGVPFSAVCMAANTSPQELDRSKAIRNIHVHNQGFVNRRNRDRIGNVEVGSYYPITTDYLIEIKDKVYLSVLGLDIASTDLYPNILAT